MVYFLLKRLGSPSDVRRMCDRQGWTPVTKIGLHCYRGSKKVRIEDGLAVRWGGMFTVPIRTINSPEAASLAAHKPRARKRLAEFGVPIPKTWFSVKDAKVPFIARPSKHSGGDSFGVIYDKKDFAGDSNWYFSEVIDSQEEYRVYVGSGEILGAYKKLFKEGEMRANRAVTGFSWGDMISVSGEVEKAALMACEALKLDTGGVDIMVADKPYVIEVNSTPAISNDQTMNMYIKYFNSLL